MLTNVSMILFAYLSQMHWSNVSQLLISFPIGHIPLIQINHITLLHCMYIRQSIIIMCKCVIITDRQKWWKNWTKYGCLANKYQQLPLWHILRIEMTWYIRNMPLGIDFQRQWYHYSSLKPNIKIQYFSIFPVVTEGMIQSKDGD